MVGGHQSREWPGGGEGAELSERGEEGQMDPGKLEGKILVPYIAVSDVPNLKHSIPE